MKRRKGAPRGSTKGQRREETAAYRMEAAIMSSMARRENAVAAMQSARTSSQERMIRKIANFSAHYRLRAEVCARFGLPYEPLEEARLEEK